MALSRSSSKRELLLPAEGKPIIGRGTLLKVVSVAGALDGAGEGDGSADPVDRLKRLLIPRDRGGWLALGG